jgi:hypothetical protein
MAKAASNCTCQSRRLRSVLVKCGLSVWVGIRGSDKWFELSVRVYFSVDWSAKCYFKLRVRV